MDRKLPEPAHAGAELLYSMMRRIEAIEQRLGGGSMRTLVVDEIVPYVASVDPNAAYGLASLDMLSGRWFAAVYCELSQAFTTGEQVWIVDSEIYARGTTTPIPAVSPVNGYAPTVLPKARIDVTWDSASPGGIEAVTHLPLCGFGWLSVDPNEYPEGFTFVVRLTSPGVDGGVWPTVTNLRIATLPF